MCYFVTVAVPVEQAAALEKSIPRGLALHPVAPGSILRVLPAGYRAYVLTSGMCSCELFRAPEPPANEGRRESAARLRRKYAKRGWSDAKAARALAQAASHATPEQTFVGLRPDVRA